MVCLLSKNLTPLMPVTEKKARKLLKSGQAEIYKRRPLFVIRLLNDCKIKPIQPIELKANIGYDYLFVSLCCEKYELYSAEYRLLKNEKANRDDKRNYRRSRRNRLRYRRARFDNRKIPQGWFAPSIVNREQRQLDIIRSLADNIPISAMYIKIGEYDIQLLQTIEEDKSKPVGDDYQKGPLYEYNTLKTAVMERDGYSCRCCGKKASDKRKLLLYNVSKEPNKTKRMKNLITVCNECLIPSNLASGKLNRIVPTARDYKGEAYLNTVRRHILNTLKAEYPGVPIYSTYGAWMKTACQNRNLTPTPENKTFCMGKIFPAKRAVHEVYEKRRRNNRILQIWQDAKYIESRDGSVKSGYELSCNRTNRSIPRNNANNLRKYRLHKVNTPHAPRISPNGKQLDYRCRYRFKRHDLSKGDVAILKRDGKTGRCILGGVSSGGKNVIILKSKFTKNGKPIVSSTPKCIVGHYHCGGWRKLTREELSKEQKFTNGKSD